MKKKEFFDVLVIGSGQAGLAMSYLLKKREISHLILEKGEIANSWCHQRWDSFRLVTQNWQNQLPGFFYDGDQPEGWMTKEEVIQYLVHYRLKYDLPVREHCQVNLLSQEKNKLFTAETSSSRFFARAVIIATGSFERPLIASSKNLFPPQILQLHSSAYKNPNSLPPKGSVLVIGGGQSGLQIAGEIHRSGREVFLSLDRTYSIPRTYRGRDIMHWLTALKITDIPLHQFPDGKRMAQSPSPVIRDPLNDLQALGRTGIQFIGKFLGVYGSKILFNSNLKKTLEASEFFEVQLTKIIDRYIEKNGLHVPPTLKRARRTYDQSELNELDINQINLSTIIFAIGFKPDYSWIHLPLFDRQGIPKTNRGQTSIPGIYFLGLHWLYTLKSSSLYGVGKDAKFLLNHVKSFLDSSPTGPTDDHILHDF